jgi:hypothetical protein
MQMTRLAVLPADDACASLDAADDEEDGTILLLFSELLWLAVLLTALLTFA